MEELDSAYARRIEGAVEEFKASIKPLLSPFTHMVVDSALERLLAITNLFIF